MSTNPSEINPNHIAKALQKENGIIFLNGRFYLYKDGVYRESEHKIASLIKQTVGERFRTHLLKEIKASLQADTLIEAHTINLASDYLNLKNGLLNLKTEELISPCREYRSTIQLPCDYDPEAKCEKWLDFLVEVLGDELEKIDILQEFFGYSLTSLTNQEKALMMLGDGSNGKSVVLNVLEGVIGLENRAAVPLEQFKNPNYLAELFGKLINISYESNSKTQVYESTFKQLVSGETIAADQKYGHPFTFKNTCKMIFAFNEFPRVDDKTNAYYRRIIPIPFNVQIAEHKQNKDLSRILLEEKSGILNWAICGLKRLTAQGRFSVSKSSQALIEDYRKDNNNVMGFVDEKCELDSFQSCTKDSLYRAYKIYCEDYGYSKLGDKKFGKQIRKYCHSVSEDRTADAKLWTGIQIK